MGLFGVVIFFQSVDFSNEMPEHRFVLPKANVILLV